MLTNVGLYLCALLEKFTTYRFLVRMLTCIYFECIIYRCQLFLNTYLNWTYLTSSIRYPSILLPFVCRFGFALDSHLQQTIYRHFEFMCNINSFCGVNGYSEHAEIPEEWLRGGQTDRLEKPIQLCGTYNHFIIIYICNQRWYSAHITRHFNSIRKWIITLMHTIKSGSIPESLSHIYSVRKRNILESVAVWLLSTSLSSTSLIYK